MLHILKRVRGAVADRGVVPELTHFFVYQGRIQGSNSRLAIDAPLPELGGVSFTVPADKFIRAVDCMEEEPKLEVSTTKLTLKHGRLTVRLPLLANDAYPRSVPNAPEWEPESPLLPVLEALRPFCSTDAHNAWSLGVLLTEDYAHATNNTCIVRMPCDLLAGTKLRVNLPVYAVDELLRIGEEPTHFGVDERSITFHLADGSWVRTQMIAAEWPLATLANLYAQHWPAKAKVPKVPAQLLEAVTAVLPFSPSAEFPVVVFADGKVCTEDGEHSAEVEGYAGMLAPMRWNGNILKLVLEHATHIQLNKPDTTVVPFAYGKVQGVAAALVR